MNKKNLPVKLFEKRKEIDERRIEGGGDKKLPKWVLSEPELKLKSEEFTSVIHNKINDFANRSKIREFIPVTLTLELNQNARAKSHRSEIKKIFNVNYKYNLIGFSGENNIVVKIDNINDAKTIEKNINEIDKFKIGLSAIDHLDDFKPEVLLANRTSGTIKVSLLNYQEFELNNSIKLTFEYYLKENNIKYRKAYYSPELIIYKIIDINESTIDSLKEFEAIESISFMPQYEVNTDFVDQESDIAVKEPVDGVNYPTVGILDSGVAKNKYTEPWLIEKKFSAYPEDRIDKRHGTFVTGVILYGDELEERNLTGLEGCKIFDATVMPDTKKETIMEDELIENIREAIKENSEIKIWNMSLGTREEADEHEFSHFAQALDNIQEVNNVLICKSAGNCTNFVNGQPKSRISKSADSIHSLVVGSIAHKKSENDQAEVNFPSPFTRIGRGPAHIIKPELVSYGGNAHYDGRKIVRNGVKSISPSGQAVSDVGTSFSTPRVTALLAALNLNITEEFNPLLLKALAIHSATYPEELKLQISDKLKLVGFGLPTPVNNILYNDDHEITLILQDTLIKGEFMQILEFPFPESLIDNNGYFYGVINITLVGLPVLRNQGGEYCQSNLDVKFGTYDEIKERDTSIPMILNEIGPDGAINVLRNSNYSKRFAKDTESTYSNERVLINYGNKYHPIKKYSINLEEMTTSKKEDALKTPKNWYLQVKGLYRDFVEEIAKQDGEELHQEYVLILTIKDPKKEKLVYNEVSQLLNNRNFNHNDINLRSDVRISNVLNN
ncbi:MAG: S8 family serine peptidase [Bacteroidales bacterium]|nr:S8 family serine peptidase [Bacteroidales bacterium]